MFLKKILSFLVIVLFTITIYSNPIDSLYAKKIALGFYKEKHKDESNKIANENSIKLVTTLENNSNSLAYVYNLKDKNSFVIISANKSTIPIIGYSLTSNFDITNLPPALKAYLDSYLEQIDFLTQKKCSGNACSDWTYYENIANKQEIKNKKTIVSVGPLLTTKWGQNEFYNELCPKSTLGPGGHVLVGCVAVSLGQVLAYYKYPDIGNGSSQYSSNYGTQSVNYGQETYNWDRIYNMISSSNEDVAKLLYHCAVSVRMSFGPNGSSASTDAPVNSLKNYFRYSDTITFIRKNSGYTDSLWSEAIKEELINGRPVIYSGVGSKGGHSWVCDGYDENNYFHMNWGWDGYQDTYFLLTNLVAPDQTFNFPYYHEAITKIIPNEKSFPFYCDNSNVFENIDGVFSDGSSYLNYNNNSDCEWLIKPKCGSKIYLSYDKLNVDSTDTLFIYDGPDKNYNLLSFYTAGKNFSTITSTQNQMLVNFKTDSSKTSEGWTLMYKVNDFCKSINNLTNYSGEITDGSDSCNYKSATQCSWTIRPENAEIIILSFSELNLGQGDYINIEDATVSPKKLITKIEGTSIPDDIYIEKSAVSIKFVSDYAENKSGFKLNYNVFQVGIDENDSNEKYSFYPNPANDYLIFKNNSNNQGLLSIYDANGCIVLNEKINTVFNKINLQQLSSGFYTINFDNNYNTLIIKK